MTRAELVEAALAEAERLTRLELLEAVLELDRRNRKAAHLLRVGQGQGLVPIAETINTLEGRSHA
jgi:hypothetical protein